MQLLFTKEGLSLPPVPWETYPRPQMRREEWLCLNGEWELSAAGRKPGKIRVPFCPESLLSEAKVPPAVGEVLLYHRSFFVPESWSGRHVLLHFGAVSRDAVVLINGFEICHHQNGYLPFSADITEALCSGENELTLRVVNDLDHRYPWGKQTVKRGGMWYTPCSGIWQTVWLEPVPQEYIHSLRIETGADWAEIEAEGVRSGTILLGDESFYLAGGKVRIKLPESHLWSPDDPYLYSFTVVSGEDRVESYFALRTLTVETVYGVPRLCLNGKPTFFHGLLDQGYWSDGLYTPASPACYERDILSMKSLGFNTLRKHIKIEPEQFYYDCDRLGMIVFQDMVNNGEYHYLQDTVLPTVGLKRMNDKKRNPDPDARSEFLSAMEDTVHLLRNHPCICLWTIFNEGWGQFCADDAYRRLKELDNSRFIDSTSGWFHQKENDVDSLHIYFRRLRLGRETRPQLLSEFGGYVWKDPTHSFNPDQTYGYRKLEGRESYVAALRKLYEEEVLPLIRKGLCGAVYTQVSDVEDETNGLLSFDREVLKLKPEEFRDLSDRLYEAIVDPPTV